MKTQTAETLRLDRLEVGDSLGLVVGARKVVLRGGGRRHGPITRLVSPSDIGELIKPHSRRQTKTHPPEVSTSRLMKWRRRAPSE